MGDILTGDQKNSVVEAMLMWYDERGHDLDQELNGDQIASIVIEAIGKFWSDLSSYYFDIADSHDQADILFRFKCELFSGLRPKIGLKQP